MGLNFHHPGAEHIMPLNSKSPPTVAPIVTIIMIKSLLVTCLHAYCQLCLCFFFPYSLKHFEIAHTISPRAHVSTHWVHLPTLLQMSGCGEALHRLRNMRGKHGALLLALQKITPHPTSHQNVILDPLSHQQAHDLPCWGGQGAGKPETEIRPFRCGAVAATLIYHVPR